MKVSTITFKQVVRYAALCVLSVVLLSSCKKDDPYNFEGTLYANVNFINTSPDAGTAGFYVENILRTPKVVAYGDASGYNKTYAGDQDISAKSASENTLVSSTAQFDVKTNYTVFLVGQTTALGLLKVTDDQTAPSSNKAKVRFVNTSPSASSASLLTSATTGLFSNIAYRAVSDYAEVDAGSYSLSVLSGNNRSAATGVTFASGKIYTVYAKGVIGNGTTPFSVGVFLNN
ncbi:DUF4397 domain-containing protein [Mucilaginibacter lacusdianchii]|uniref:DUF4397 domain-containing protein n=1 Tax=Mucilaginibacter lacusdianchii TaxID=2684211 RepID=UPI00131E525C|nr:DUF4397 domain-containing protein [Mucilaginibacter sp. JXJ CY 39]